MNDRGFTSNVWGFLLCFNRLFWKQFYSEYRHRDKITELQSCILKYNIEIHYPTSLTVFSLNFKMVLTAKQIFFR